MSLLYRRPGPDDVAALAKLAATYQRDPAFHNPYLGFEAEAIASDIEKLEGWADGSTVATNDAGRIVGWLIGEIDPDMGRLWWWGPFIADSQDWDEVADELYRRTRAVIPPSIDEEEACGDERSETLRAWCARHGFKPEEASVLLRRQPGPAATDPRVRPLGPSDHEAVMALHHLAFPGTHLTPAAVVGSEHPRLVIEVDDAVVGYVAYERHSDDSGYLDYLAVADRFQGRGLGGALVDHACHLMFADDVAYAHLTVRESNGAARALYRRLGFVEERLARPYRLGFSLA